MYYKLCSCLLEVLMYNRFTNQKQLQMRRNLQTMPTKGIFELF